MAGITLLFYSGCDLFLPFSMHYSFFYTVWFFDAFFLSREFSSFGSFFYLSWSAKGVFIFSVLGHGVMGGTFMSSPADTFFTRKSLVTLGGGGREGGGVICFISTKLLSSGRVGGNGTKGKTGRMVWGVG